MPRRKTAKPKLKVQSKKTKTRSRSKKPGRVSSRQPRWVPLLMILIGLTMVDLWGMHKFLYYRALTMARTQVSQVIQAEPAPLPLPTHIFIPWNTDAEIEPLGFVGGEWQISDTKVTYLLGSARPGEAGNIILYGHNKREILGNIRVLKGGEDITITTADQKKHTYIVRRVAQVDPSKVDWLKPTTSETLTLYTCAGFWDSQRYIVQAIPKQ